jgi:chorismate mutase
MHDANSKSTLLSDSENTSKDTPIQIFGPCSAESEKQVYSTANAVKDYFPNAIFRAGVWKPRTRPGSFEGLGNKALPWLKKVQHELGLKVITEVASPQHVEEVLKAGLDMVWIGARTTVSPFAIQELAESLKGVDIPVFVKNPVNPDLGLWIGAIERFANAGIINQYAIHRGFHSFETTPYRNSPRWELVIDFRTQLPDIPVICDASHISGAASLIHSVAQKSIDLDYQGLMIETHINPSAALSDARQQISPMQLSEIYFSLTQRKAHFTGSDMNKTLLELRSRVDSADDSIIQSLISRKRLIEEIGHHKKNHSITILQLQRWEEILERQLKHGRESGLSEQFVKQLYEVIHAEAIRLQQSILSSNRL